MPNAESPCFVFPGQGSQEVGMGKLLLETSPAAVEIFEQAEAVLTKLGWKSQLRNLCLLGPADTLNDTSFAQPALLTVSIAMERTLASQGITPVAATGHSMGEYSALVATKVLRFENAVYLVSERGRLMKQAGEKNPGKMAVILGLSVASTETLCNRLISANPGSNVQIANINAPNQIVISGDSEAVQNAHGFAQELGARKTILLPISIAAHSACMQPVVDEMRHVLSSIPLFQPKVPFYSPTSGRQETDPKSIYFLLISQLTGRVLWMDTIQQMIRDGYNSFLEVGPKKVLSGLIHTINPNVQVTS